MENISKIKEKIIELLKYIELDKKITPDIVTSKFKEIFKNQYIPIHNSINQAYYQCSTLSYYIKNGYGIVLEIVSGTFDRYGNNVSHIGKDIIIYSKLSKHEICRKGIYLFSEDLLLENSLLNNLDFFFDLDLSVKNMLSSSDNYIYKILPDKIKNHLDIAFSRYENIKKSAIFQNKDERSYYNISPYGGTDVVLHKIDDLIYEKLSDFNDDYYFMKRAFALFHNEYPEYLQNKINEVKHALYIIKHQKEYLELLNICKSINKHKTSNCSLIIEKNEIERELENLSEYIKKLERKTYNILDILKGKIKKNRIEICKYQEKINIYIKKLTKIYNLIINSYSFMNDEYYQDLLIRKHEIYTKLKQIPFKNFTMYDDEYDFFYDSGDSPIMSLNKLIQQKVDYINKLNELVSQKSMAERYLKYTINQLKRRLMKNEQSNINGKIN